MAEIEQMEASLLDYLKANFGDIAFSLAGLLQQTASEVPDKPALLEPGRASLTYSGLFKLAENTVRALNWLGFTPSSRIAIVLPTTSEAATVYLSVMSGMTVIPIGPGLPADEYERYLRHARGEAVLVEQGTEANACEAAARLGIPIVEIVYSKYGAVGAFYIAGSITTTEREPQFAQPTDTAVVLPTSGTLSLPKLVPRTHRELALLGYFAHLMFYVQDVPYPLFNMLPLHHASGFSPLVRSVAGKVGFVCVLASQLKKVYKYLAQYRPASLLVVPSVLETLLSEVASHGDERAQLDLKRITVVSSALPEAVLQKAQRIFQAPVQILYGMTEMNTISSTLHPIGNTGKKVGFVGQTMPFCQIRVADEDGAPVQAGVSGEIWVRSPLLFTGYENNPEANKEAFHKGWFRTGDAGHMDANGDLYLTGRVREQINRGGSKVSPFDVDEVLIQHPAVLDAATFGFPHSVLGEDVAAAVVVTNESVTERELRSFAARRLAMHKVPSRFVFVQEIPKTTLGKIRRLELTEQFKAELER